MTTYKLTYFDMDAGRAEAIRIAFHAAGIAFDDNRISFPEFGEMRTTARFNAVPILEIDGAQVSQSNALSRYVGKMAGLYPTDDLQALYCDEVMGALEDIYNHIGKTFGLEGDALELARKTLVDGWLTVFLKGLNELLTRGGGDFYADNQLTIADLKAFTLISWLGSGMLDHIPADIVQQVAPALLEHQKRVMAEPRVAAYYVTRQ